MLAGEDERTGPNPMLRVDAPKTTRKVKPVLGDDDVRALLGTCDGKGFEARRDAAIIRLMIDAGTRVTGVADILKADLQLPQRHAKVVLKGGDEYLIPFGSRAAVAVDRYLRARSRHKQASSPYLWLGVRGGAETDGVGP